MNAIEKLFCGAKRLVKRYTAWAWNPTHWNLRHTIISYPMGPSRSEQNYSLRHTTISYHMGPSRCEQNSSRALGKAEFVSSWKSCPHPLTRDIKSEFLGTYQARFGPNHSLFLYVKIIKINNQVGSSLPIFILCRQNQYMRLWLYAILFFLKCVSPSRTVNLLANMDHEKHWHLYSNSAYIFES